MKLIMAAVKTHKLEEVREAITQAGVEGLTVSEARGYGREKGKTKICRGTRGEFRAGEGGSAAL